MEATQTNPGINNVIEIRNFSVTIGARHVLHNVNLSAAEKQITAVIGPSGSGKSVILKSIVGLFRGELTPTTKLIYGGEIIYGGKNLLHLREYELEKIRRRIAYVSQYPVAFPGSIYENISLALKYWEPDLLRRDLDSIVERALHQVRLWDEVQHRLYESPRDLSAGQLQRLSVARAIALEPELLLLDEPCAYIDPISTLSLEELFYELRQDRTIFIVTHNLQQAARISDMTLFMTVRRSDQGNDLVGEIVEFGQSNAVFTNPQDRRTEDYIVGRFG